MFSKPQPCSHPTPKISSLRSFSLAFGLVTPIRSFPSSSNNLTSMPNPSTIHGWLILPAGSIVALLMLFDASQIQILFRLATSSALALQPLLEFIQEKQKSTQNAESAVAAPPMVQNDMMSAFAAFAGAAGGSLDFLHAQNTDQKETGDASLQSLVSVTSASAYAKATEGLGADTVRSFWRKAAHAHAQAGLPIQALEMFELCVDNEKSGREFEQTVMHSLLSMRALARAEAGRDWGAHVDEESLQRDARFRLPKDDVLADLMCLKAWKLDRKAAIRAVERFCDAHGLFRDFLILLAHEHDHGRIMSVSFFFNFSFTQHSFCTTNFCPLRLFWRALNSAQHTAHLALCPGKSNEKRMNCSNVVTFFSLLFFLVEQPWSSASVDTQCSPLSKVPHEFTSNLPCSAFAT
jgi:hypothetical protein